MSAKICNNNTENNNNNKYKNSSSYDILITCLSLINLQPFSSRPTIHTLKQEILMYFPSPSALVLKC
jgi:hypothetical protein